ncbi:hypothetical protein [Spirosoma flavum]|uniref:Uncharacterized protein n=1 Tax=Spirosoma flavum TaxID=2048557 RepID=A0ABW6ARI7_9BACT
MPTIHQGLRNKALLPTTHLVDIGYIDATTLLDSQEQYKIDFLGPARLDIQWQAAGSNW